MLTDSATSPRARKQITFDAVPPAQLPTRTIPTVSGVESCKSFASVSARIGIRRNCRATPTATGRGSRAMRWASSRVSVRPIINMIEASRGIIINCAATKESGLSAPVAATAIARVGKSFVRRDWGERTGKGGRVLCLTVGRLLLLAGMRGGLFRKGLYREGLYRESLCCECL